jgi:hypothetical protein
MAASSLDRNAVGQLTGRPSDSRSSAFATVRAELKEIQQAVPNARFTYLMGQRDGMVIFLADAEDESSPDYSPPGQAYPEASPGLLGVFSGGKPFVEEPYRDRWGEWTSGLAPVKDRATGGVIAVLGIDIPANRWREQIDGYRVYGAVIAGLIVALMGIVLFVQSQEPPPF